MLVLSHGARLETQGHDSAAYAAPLLQPGDSPHEIEAGLIKAKSLTPPEQSPSQHDPVPQRSDNTTVSPVALSQVSMARCLK